MKIKNKILLYFSVTYIILIGIMFVVVYWLFSEYREEDFQQRQKDKIISTLYLISEIEKHQNNIVESIDQLTINSLLNEKLLIFDSTKKLIYSSLDDVSITYSEKLLNSLNEHNQWIETKDSLYDVVAISFKSNNKLYYGISKAYDKFGYTKLIFLRNILILSFFVFAVLIIVISIYFSNLITKPLVKLANILEKFKIEDSPKDYHIQTNTLELNYLNEKFYELLNRVNHAYAFQKNSIHHISHQLKTPIAILVSELERIKQNATEASIQTELEKQIAKAKSFAEIINTLLQISKIVSGQEIKKTKIRVDEIIFDFIDESNRMSPNFIFEINYKPSSPEPNKLIIYANEMLIRQVFQNILNNCIAYSNTNKAEIKFDCTKNKLLEIKIINRGKPISKGEEKFLFTHFFRGENSRNKIGFGLGLTLSKSILDLHNATIQYANPEDDVNIFNICFHQA